MPNTEIIDISSDNGSVDFSAVAAAGIQHVILRACLGYGQNDNNLMTNAANALAAGIGIGFYHLAYTHQVTDVAGDAAKEANWFCDQIAKTGVTPECIALDLETPTQLSTADYEDWIASFISTVKSRTGIDTIIYSYKSWLDSHLDSSHYLGGSQLWIANYENVETPPLPEGWSEYYMWQFSETGTMSGVNGKVDCSQFLPSN